MELVVVAQRSLPFQGMTLHSSLTQTPVTLGLYSLRRRRLISIGIPMINLRRSSDRLRFIMGIPIPVRRRLLSEWRPWNRCRTCTSSSWPGASGCTCKQVFESCWAQLLCNWQRTPVSSVFCGVLPALPAVPSVLYEDESSSPKMAVQCPGTKSSHNQMDWNPASIPGQHRIYAWQEAWWCWRTFKMPQPSWLSVPWSRQSGKLALWPLLEVQKT